MTVAEWNERALLRRQIHAPTGAVVHTESAVWTCAGAWRTVKRIDDTPIPERVGRRTRITRIYVAGPDRGRRGAEMLAQRIRMAGVAAKVGSYAGLPQEAGHRKMPATNNGSYITIEEVLDD